MRTLPALALLAALTLTGCAPDSREATPGSPARQSGGTSGGLSPDIPARSTPSGPHRVVTVIDGDTLKVDVGGRTETVRLIGIDTPETRDPRRPVQCYGAEASARAEALLADREVTLESDPSQDDRDRYGRLLRWVRVEGQLVNAQLVAEGYALEYTFRSVPHAYQEQLRALQAQAKSAERGLWSPSTCAGDPTRPAR